MAFSALNIAKSHRLKIKSHLTNLVFFENDSASTTIFKRLLHETYKPLKISIVGAPFEKGQPHSGVQKSPDLLRQSGLLLRLKELGHIVEDEGNVSFNAHDPEIDYKNSKNLRDTLEFNRELSEKVRGCVKKGNLCITIGGDHSIGLGSVYGHARAYPEDQDICLLWVDAHADINTPETSLTGNTHGMPVSMHIREIFANCYSGNLEFFKWFIPKLRAKHVGFIGLREVDPCEASFLDQLKISHYSMREVDELGVREVVRRCLEKINPGRKLPLHVSFDIDALDPQEAPATGTKVPGGLTLREGLTIMEDCHSTGCLRAVDIVEVNPSLANDPSDVRKTVEAAKRLILAAAGFPRRSCAI